MDIDFKTGKVSYPERDAEKAAFIQSLEDLKLKDSQEPESVFSKTRHENLKYGRLKFMFYCFLLMVDGLIGLVSIGQTQSIIAQKYLMSDHVIGDYNHRQNSS